MRRDGVLPLLHPRVAPEFVRAILRGGAVEPDFEEGVRYMEFTEAVAISAHTGHPVTLPPEPTMEVWGQPLLAHLTVPESGPPNSARL